jgi:hypothetical protein
VCVKESSSVDAGDTLRPVESSVCIDHPSHTRSVDSIGPHATPRRPTNPLDGGEEEDRGLARNVYAECRNGPASLSLFCFTTGNK